MMWFLVELLSILMFLFLRVFLVQINLLWALECLEAVFNLIFLKLVVLDEAVLCWLLHVKARLIGGLDELELILKVRNLLSRFYGQGIGQTQGS